MRAGEASSGALPQRAADSDVTRQLCAALRAHPARADGSTRQAEARLLQLVRDGLREPARSVPSYGFDLVPVLVHGVRALRRRRIRRLVLAAALGLVAAWAPIPALTWLGALVVAWAVGPSGPSWALVPLIGCWVFTLLSTTKIDDSHELWVRGALLPFALAAVVTLVYVVDGMVTRRARRRPSGDDGTPAPLPSIGARARGRVEWIGARQYGTALPYDLQGRFIGAGREARGAAEIRVPLRPGQPERPVVALREAEVLDSIGAAVAAGPGEVEETAPLPGFSVAHVLALPAELWLERSRSGAGEPDTPWGLDRPERPYLRAQCVSWRGQLVVSLFVHAALQAGELRLTMRPQVMAPLVPLPAPAGPGALDGLRGAVGLWQALWREIRKAPGRKAERADQAGPLSLRDALSQPEVSDLHQKNDAERHIELMQAAFLSAVEALLDRHGYATQALHDRRAVINSIQVLGDNNAGIQLAGGLTLTQVAQTTPPAPAAAPAPIEGALMSPGFSRRDPAPEPARPAGHGISIGGNNTGTAQNAVGHSLSHITQTGAGQSGVPLGDVAALLTAFRADIDRHAALLADPEALRDQSAVLAGALTDPESDGFRPALRTAVRSLPALVAGTVVEHSGEALVEALRQVLG